MPFSHTCVTKSDEWVQTVHKLANRYVEAGALLDFFERLSETKPSYNPRVHTTNDVVRGAIIPLPVRMSRGYALADMMSKTDLERPFPDCMVTHDWHNLFSHLVAAVMADSFDKDEYGPIAEMLCTSDGVKSLRRRLLEVDGASRRYCICAFCVNLHAGICGGFPPAPPECTPECERWDAMMHDSATGDVHQLCTCCEPKYFRDSPELCDMYKFDDMVLLLNIRTQNFRQVIAIDRQFDLFTRAWCVAELVQARIAHIPQYICLMSTEALDANSGDLCIYIKLATLSVADCTATYIDDKKEIMDKIPDVAEFDAQLQAAIFGSSGLFGKHMVGFDLLYTAARTASRVDAAMQRKTTNLSIQGPSA